MRIAVAGRTGLAGRHTVTALRQAGHDAVVLARSVGVDLTTGHGLVDALVGVDAAIDVTNFPTSSPEQARAFFTTATRQLLAAEHHAGVGHHVVLSIVGIDRVKGNAHYAGKRAQERVALAARCRQRSCEPLSSSTTPPWSCGGRGTGRWPRCHRCWFNRSQSPTSRTSLVQIAAGAPQHGVREPAGPEPQDLVDMVRRLLAVRGESLRLLPSWGGRFGVELAGEVLLPGPDAQIAPTTFESWLAAQARPADTGRSCTGSTDGGPG